MPIITRKIQLFISDYDKTTKKFSISNKNNETYKFSWSELNKLNNQCYKLANLVSTKLITNTNFLTEKFVDTTDNKRDNSYNIGKNVAESQNFDFDGYSVILNSTAKIAKDKLRNDSFEIKIGNKSVSTYKKGMPIPFQSQSAKIIKQDDGYYFKWYKLNFFLNFGRDKSNNRAIVDEVNNGKYKFCDSSIQVKDGKIFLLLVVKFPETKVELDENICLGVDLGLSCPAYLALSNNKHYRKSLGNFKDYVKRRLMLQGVYKRNQQNDVGVNGKGRKKKMKKLNNLSEIEKNYCSTYEHRIAKLVIDEAIKNRAGVVKLENLKGFNNEFALRNWGYFGYQTKIIQKASKYGIKVIFVNPRNTSKTCSECGEINTLLDCENKNKQMNNKREWVCPKCGKTLQRDWNAAYNIATSNDIVK